MDLNEFPACVHSVLLQAPPQEPSPLLFCPTLTTSPVRRSRPAFCALIRTRRRSTVVWWSLTTRCMRERRASTWPSVCLWEAVWAQNTPLCLSAYCQTRTTVRACLIASKYLKEHEVFSPGNIDIDDMEYCHIDDLMTMYSWPEQRKTQTHFCVLNRVNK